jgi:hypothetical protein
MRKPRRGCSRPWHDATRVIGGLRMTHTKDTLERSLYSIDPITDCWNWCRAKQSGGYGVLWVPNRRRYELAHRLSYRLFHALDDIPKNVVIHHRCENRGCVNPEHLEITTRGHNCRIGRKAILNADQAAAIRSAVASGRLQKDVAQEFGVHKATVQSIVAGRRWSD